MTVEGTPMAKDDHEDVPDWTVWLRSRLERVSGSEGKAGDDAPAPPGSVSDSTPPGLGGHLDSGDGPRLGEAIALDPHPGDGFAGHAGDAERSHGEGDHEAPLEAAIHPGEVPARALAPELPAEAEVPPPPHRSWPVPGEGDLVAGLESLRSATTALTARVDALADATSSFRSVLNERLDEYAETVMRVTKSTSADVEEYRRMHSASILELRRTGAETADSLARLAGRMDELATIQADDERWAEVMGQLCDEVTAERLRGDRAVAALSDPGADIGPGGAAAGGLGRWAAMEATLDRLSSEVATLAAKLGEGATVPTSPGPPPEAEPELELTSDPGSEARSDEGSSTAVPLGPGGPPARTGGPRTRAGAGAAGRPPRSTPVRARPPAKEEPGQPAARPAPRRTRGAGTAAPTGADRAPARRPRRTTPIRVRGDAETTDS